MKAVFFYSDFPLQKRKSESDYLDIVKMTLKVNSRYFDAAILYTTLGTIVDQNLGFNKIIPFFSTQLYLTHYVRVLTWLHYIQSDEFDQDTIFLDADVILNKDVRDVFDNDFCLAFSACQPDGSESLINAGVFFANHVQKDQAILHMKKIVKCATLHRFDKDPRFPLTPSAAIWGLDEKSVTEYLRLITKRNRQIDITNVVLSLGLKEFRPLTDGISLFGVNYNLKAKDYDRSLWSQAAILHFCGLRSYKRTQIIKEYLIEQNIPVT